MKSHITKITFLLVLSLSFLSCAQNSKSETNTIEKTKEVQVISRISPEELKAEAGDIQLIDIRTPQEYAQGHIKNATNINFYDRNFTEEINKLDKTKEIYIYCRSGGRSGKASRQLEKMGFTKVYDLRGGILNWQRNDLEVIK